MRRTITSLLAVLAVVALQAQVPDITQKAAKLYQEKAYEEARVLIDESIASEGAEDSYTWHVRGHIYKEIYKQVDKFDRQTKSRAYSVESFLKSLSLDASNEYAEWNRTSLKYLSSTYWNDAVNIIENGSSEELPEAEVAYEQYVKTQEQFNEDFNANKVTLDFYKAYATANRKIIEKKRSAGTSPEEYVIELERIRKCYEKALQADFDDYGSNYNFAINLYNEAAYRIERIPADADLTFLLLEQEGCIAIFKEALPFAEKAYDKKPGRIEILKALRAIYLSLSDYDKFDQYDILIKEKQGEMRAPSEKKLTREMFGREKLDR